MYWRNHTIGAMKRNGKFCFRVGGLYWCRRNSAPQIGPLRQNYFEVCVRLESAAQWCDDVINGEKQHVPFPNVAWKRPGKEVVTRHHLRDVLAFSYPEETMREFFRIGMEPAENCRAFTMTPEIERLVLELRGLIYHLYTPGVPDRVDWTCFQLYKNLLAVEKTERENRETIIRNLFMWLQTHYDKPVDMTELAQKNGMSRTKFYVKWKKTFSVSPVQYQLDCKLEAAAMLLRQTPLPIAGIVRNVHFSGVYAFHKRFLQKYGMTPGAYRKAHLNDYAFPDGEIPPDSQ